jgi:ectoine hydroxylase-related dioxygenase (phytanoyl-CoA dioxygenase family)
MFLSLANESNYTHVALNASLSSSFELLNDQYSSTSVLSRVVKNNILLTQELVLLGIYRVANADRITTSRGEKHQMPLSKTAIAEWKNGLSFISVLIAGLQT